MRFKDDLKAQQDSSSPESEEALQREEEDLRKINERIKNKIKVFIRLIGDYDCDDNEGRTFLNNELLTGDGEAWKVFADHLFRNDVGITTDDIEIIINKCGLEKTSHVVKKIFEMYQERSSKRVKWSHVLNIFLEMGRYDVLHKLLIKNILKRIHQSVIRESDLILGQLSIRQPVEDDDSNKLHTDGLESEPINYQEENLRSPSNETEPLNKNEYGLVSINSTESNGCNSYGSSSLNLLLEEESNSLQTTRHSSSESETQQQFLSQADYAISHTALKHDNLHKSHEVGITSSNNNSCNTSSPVRMPLNEANHMLVECSTHSPGPLSALDQEETGNGKIIILLTYSSDAKLSSNIIYRRLKEANIHVITVEKLRHLRRGNVIDHIERVVDRAHFVVPIISPKYIEDINKIDDPQTPEESFVRFIYTRYRNRYVNNGCYNTDVRALKLPNVTFPMMKNLVDCLQNPRDFPNDIEKFIKNLRYAYKKKVERGQINLSS